MIRLLRGYGVQIVVLSFVALFSVSAYLIMGNDGLGAVSTSLQVKAPTERIIFNKEIDDIRCDSMGKNCENFGKIITYDYVSDIEVQPKTVRGMNEIVEMRNESSRFYKTGNENEYLMLVEGSGMPFWKLGDKWFEVKTRATTTIDIFEKHKKTSWLENIFGTKAFATATTSYSGVGDGYVFVEAADTWDNIHDATTGTAANYTVEDGGCTFTNDNGSGTRQIQRVFFPFYTVGIPSGSTVSSSTLYLNFYGKGNGDDSGYDYLTIVETSQASHTTLAVGDYSLCGAINNPTEGIPASEHKDITTLSISGYTSFTFNSTGNGWIKASGENSTCGSSLTGWSCIGLRDGNDVEDVAIAVGKNNYTSVQYSENTDHTTDPYLEIIYSSAPPPAGWEFYHID